MLKLYRNFSAALVTLVITGCAGVQQSINAYEASAIVAIRAAEDNNIALWTANACGTPFSAIMRNPAIMAALKDLCVPPDTNAAALLSPRK